jgi:hypothetical protein
MIYKCVVPVRDRYSEEDMFTLGTCIIGSSLPQRFDLVRIVIDRIGATNGGFIDIVDSSALDQVFARNVTLITDQTHEVRTRSHLIFHNW